MEGFLWNDMQNCNSDEDTGDLESNVDIFQWDDIPEFPITHPQHHDQAIQDIQLQQEIHNTQSTQSCAFSQTSNLTSTMHVSLQNQHEDVFSFPILLIRQDIKQGQEMPTMQSTQLCAFFEQRPLISTMQVQESLQNQDVPREQEIQTMQSTQCCAFFEQGSLISTMDSQESVQNQMTDQLLQDHLQHEDLQNMQPVTFYPPRQFPLNDDQLSIHNQECLQENSMFDISQHSQHLTNQATLSASKDVFSSEAVVDKLPTSVVTQQQYHQDIQQQLPAETPPRTFPHLLAQSLMSKHTPGLPMINQEQNISSQMCVVHEPSDSNLEQLKEEVLLQYASTFKIRRTALGLSQDDVVLELFQMYEKKVWQNQISRFETFKLKLKTMCDLKLFLDRWLANIEATLRMYQSLNKINCNRFCNTIIIYSTTSRQVLEKAFLQNPNPAVEEIEKLAKSLTVDNAYVSTWFSNRHDMLNWIQSLTAACTVESAPQRTKDEEDLKNFAETFKQRRTVLGVSQKDVCIEIRKLQGECINAKTLSLFENGKIGFSYMRKRIPLLQQWLKDNEDSPNCNKPFSPPVTPPQLSVSSQSPTSDCDSSHTTSAILQHSSTPTNDCQQTTAQASRVSA